MEVNVLFGVVGPLAVGELGAVFEDLKRLLIRALLRLIICRLYSNLLLHTIRRLNPKHRHRRRVVEVVVRDVVEDEALAVEGRVVLVGGEHGRGFALVEGQIGEFVFGVELNSFAFGGAVEERVLRKTGLLFFNSGFRRFDYEGYLGVEQLRWPLLLALLFLAVLFAFQILLHTHVKTLKEKIGCGK